MKKERDATHIPIARISPIKLHDRAGVRGHDHGGQLSIQATGQERVVRALHRANIGYLANWAVRGHCGGDVACIRRAINNDLRDKAVGGDGGEKGKDWDEGQKEEGKHDGVGRDEENEWG